MNGFFTPHSTWESHFVGSLHYSIHERPSIATDIHVVPLARTTFRETSTMPRSATLSWIGPIQYLCYPWKVKCLASSKVQSLFIWLKTCTESKYYRGFLTQLPRQKVLKLAVWMFWQRNFLFQIYKF